MHRLNMVLRVEPAKIPCLQAGRDGQCCAIASQSGDVATAERKQLMQSVSPNVG